MNLQEPKSWEVQTVVKLIALDPRVRDTRNRDKAAQDASNGESKYACQTYVSD
jgi:hypothetical protein